MWRQPSTYTSLLLRRFNRSRIAGCPCHLIITQIDKTDNVVWLGSARQPSYTASQVKSSASPILFYIADAPVATTIRRPVCLFLHTVVKRKETPTIHLSFFFLSLPLGWTSIKPSKKFLLRSRNDGDVSHSGYRGLCTRYTTYTSSNANSLQLLLILLARSPSKSRHKRTHT